VHTTGAQGTINRIIDAFPVNQQEQMRVQLSTSLIAILSQLLLTNQREVGRIAVFEFLVLTPAIANLIRENKTFRIDSNIQTGKRYGMQLLDDHLWVLYNEGVVSLEDMMDVARQPGSMQERLDRAQAGMPGVLTAVADEEEPVRPAQ
jgi:twitching motility protein PilT